MSSAKILSSERKIVIYSFTFRELLSQKKPSFVKNGKSTTSHEELELKWRNYVYQTLHGSDAPRVVNGRVCAFLISAKQRVEVPVMTAGDPHSTSSSSMDGRSLFDQSGGGHAWKRTLDLWVTNIIVRIFSYVETP